MADFEINGAVPNDLFMSLQTYELTAKKALETWLLGAGYVETEDQAAEVSNSAEVGGNNVIIFDLNGAKQIVPFSIISDESGNVSISIEGDKMHPYSSNEEENNIPSPIDNAAENIASTFGEPTYGEEETAEQSAELGAEESGLAPEEVPAESETTSGEEFVPEGNENVPAEENEEENQPVIATEGIVITPELEKDIVEAAIGIVDKILAGDEYTISNTLVNSALTESILPKHDTIEQKTKNISINEEITNMFLKDIFKK